MSEKVEDTRNTVKEFLKDLETAQLIKFPNLSLSHIFIESQHRAEIDVLKESTMTTINKHQQKSNFIPSSEWIAFNKNETLNQMRKNSEELKTYLKAIIDPAEIDPEVNELGTYLTQIYDRLSYDQNKRKIMNDVFFKEFRNALSHLDYDITLDSLTWRNRHGSPTTWDNDYLVTVTLQMGVTVDVINEKVIEIQSKSKK